MNPHSALHQVQLPTVIFTFPHPKHPNHLGRTHLKNSPSSIKTTLQSSRARHTKDLWLMRCLWHVSERWIHIRIVKRGLCVKTPATKIVSEPWLQMQVTLITKNRDTQRRKLKWPLTSTPRQGHCYCWGHTSCFIFIHVNGMDDVPKNKS